MNEDVQDPVVAKHYRDIAAEKAPDALNQAVLREARQHAGGRYSRSIFWMRPLAWATSIGLCLAVVIELNDVPQAESPIVHTAPAAATAAEEEPARENPTGEHATEEHATEEAAMSDRDEPGVVAESMEQRARKSVDEDGRVRLNDLAQLEKAETVEQDSAPSDDFTTLDAPALEDLETLTRMREGDNSSEIPVGSAAKDSHEDQAEGTVATPREAKQAALRSFASMAAPATGLAVSAACGPAQRETPQAWLECILGLETDGMPELATREREQLREAFPEFEMP